MLSENENTPSLSTWRRMERAAFPSDDYIPLGEGSYIDTQQEQQQRPPSPGGGLPKHKFFLSGECRKACTSWRTGEYTCDPIGLHKEIIDLYEYLKPRPSEIKMRSEVIARVRRIILNRWPSARVEVFGSFSSQLYLPTSDIDLVVFGKWPKLPLFSLEEAFLTADIAVEGTILVIDKTTVPIIKFIDKETEVKVDISFNQESGVKSLPLIASFISNWPHLPKLVLILKQFLTQRQLNEVYYGGINSYSLLLMVVSFFQLHARKEVGSLDANLGVLLIEFFELYGRNFNYMKTGIRVTDGGSYFPKDQSCSDKSSILYVEDPTSASNPPDNASRGCFGMWQVKQAFENAYLKLHSTVINRDFPPRTTQSLLSLIVKVSQEVDDYRRHVGSKWGDATAAASTTVPVYAPPYMPYMAMAPPMIPSPAHGVPPHQLSLMQNQVDSSKIEFSS